MIRNDRVADQNVDGLWSWSFIMVYNMRCFREVVSPPFSYVKRSNLVQISLTTLLEVTKLLDALLLPGS